MGGRLPNGAAHGSHQKDTINIGPKNKAYKDLKTLERQRYPWDISS